MMSHPFFVHALITGTATAVACGLVGYFLVLRAQVFTSDALSHVAFTGALAALVLGVDARLGLYTATLLVATVIAGLGRRARPDDVVIGNVFSVLLGLGVFFLTLYTTNHSASHGNAGINVLFGSIFGVSSSQARLVVVVAGLVVAVLLVIARPLLLASLDETVAAARRVPVKALGLLFLALTAVCAAQATQVVGALPLLGLLAAPAGAARLLTRRPWHAFALSAALAVGATWTGLIASFHIAKLPPTFAIVATATGVYGVAFAIDRLRHRTAYGTGGGWHGEAASVINRVRQRHRRRRPMA
jgi:zinc/manganese transport system permease protein